MWQELHPIEINLGLMTVNILAYILSLVIIHFLDTWSLSIEAIPHSMQPIESHIIYTGAMAIRRK